MAIQRRHSQQTAASKDVTKAEAPAPSARRPSKPQGGKGAITKGAGTSLKQRLAGWQLSLAVVALLTTVASAACEWPIYMAYEKDWRRPAMGFGLNLGMTILVVLAVTLSPAVRAFKLSREVAQAAPARAAASSNSAQQPLSKQTRRHLVAAPVLILLAMYFGFGPFGPSGAVTTAAMSTFMFLVLP